MSAMQSVFDLDGPRSGDAPHGKLCSISVSLALS